MAVALGLSSYKQGASCVNLHLSDDQDDGMGSIIDITNDFKIVSGEKQESNKATGA